MITRRQAITQAEQCFQYHTAIAAGIVGTVAIFDRRALPWVTSALGAGVALHAACLYAIPSTRESLIRKTASLMEDHQNAIANQRQPQKNKYTSFVNEYAPIGQ